MIVFPNAKINLGLYAVAKRADGYHQIESIFYPIPLCDALEMQPADSFQFEQTGISIPGNANQNLCIKAYNLLKADFPDMKPIHMHLHKVIPTGAGLGGGSADGAFVLMQLNQQFQLGLNESQLLDYASQLGSDCAFFIKNQPCYATGRGELLSPVPLSLKGFRCCIVKPPIHIATPWAFQQIQAQPSGIRWEELNWEDPIQQLQVLTNVFESPISKQHEAIAEILAKFKLAGAAYVSMTGTGAAVYSFFESNQNIPDFNWPPTYFTFTCTL